MTYSITYSMTQTRDDKIRYRAYSFRLDDRTYKALKEIREREQISWNRLVYRLLQEYTSKEAPNKTIK